MELNEIRDMAQMNQRSISKLDEWAQATEKRVTQLESANKLLTDIQVTLKELTMESRYFGEKLDELKKAVDRNNQENTDQHKSLAKRIEDIEAKPGISWDKAKWIIISGVLGALVAFVISKIMIQ